jgi:hypothetical protein
MEFSNHFKNGAYRKAFRVGKTKSVCTRSGRKTDFLMKKVIFCLLGVLLFSSCLQKGTPSEQGVLMTGAEIKNLPATDEFNMKLVSIDGYFGFCGRFNRLKAGAKNDINITSEPDCQGDKLISAKISIKSSSSTAIAGAGEKPRNYLSAPKSITLDNIKIITDDYQEVDYQKFRFSGNLIYDNGSYYLDNVTIHIIN